MPNPLPTQLSGAEFLARRQAALLADSPRVGKTGAALIAADYILAQSILIVTTASGRAVWRRAVAEWTAFDRPPLDVLILGWPDLTGAKRAAALGRQWDLLLLDEAHYAKNFEAKRACATYGEPELDCELLVTAAAIAPKAKATWCLTGTPMPNSPADLYPMMRALCPERLGTLWGPFDVFRHTDFMKRYCVTKPKKVGQWRWIDVVIGGRNLDELGRRLDGFMLRRTQEDVGIRPPVYDLLPLEVSPANRRAAEQGLDTAAILAAAEAGSTRELEMHLGPLRRLTGEIKARAVVEALKEEFHCGLDKIVCMAWHTATLDILAEGLAEFGAVRLAGETSARDREQAEIRFRDDPGCRVFLGQIQAAGEAIDLSASAELWFVETSFTPKDMAQASLRITNHSQRRQALVKVCVLEGSIDEALQAILLRKWTAIREVLSNAQT